MAISFLNQNSECNIISVGAGFDTLYWILRESYNNFVYVELDFEEVTRKKVSFIKQYQELAVEG